MNKTQLILFGSLAAVVILAILMVLGVIPGLKKDISTVSADIVMWGVDDVPDVWNGIIAAYNGPNPDIKITYIQKDPLTYESDILNALASGAGPDIFAMPQADILKHSNKVFPLPEVSLQFSKNDFRALFADAAEVYIQNKSISGGQIVGLPISLDTLALYYNKDIFNSENIPTPPQTWDDVLTVAKKTTKVSLTGDIIQGGIALGSFKSVERAVDILSALFLQNGLTILDPETRTSDISAEQAANAAEFYRSFGDALKKNYSWSDTMQNSIQAFADGKVAMIIGFSKDYARIIAKNPRLNFGITHLPQQKGQTIRINYGVVSGYTVSRASASPIEAWRFLLFATTNSDSVKYYLNASNRPPALRQYVTADFIAPYITVFQAQVLSAKTWLQPDEKEVFRIFQNMIQSVRGNISAIGFSTGSAAGQLRNLLESVRPQEKPQQ